MEANDTEKAVYDMNEGGMQELRIKDIEGEDVFVKITQLEQKSRVTSGEYLIEYTKPSCWYAKYTISVIGNKIEKAYSYLYQSFYGTIANPRLSVDNSTQASFKFTYYIQAVGIINGMRSVISEGKIYVYGI